MVSIIIELSVIVSGFVNLDLLGKYSSALVYVSNKNFFRFTLSKSLPISATKDSLS